LKLVTALFVLLVLALPRAGGRPGRRGVIELLRVSVTFAQPGGERVHALRDVTLVVPEGQFVTVIGSNGSGKSTMLSAVAGTVAPAAGEVRIAGNPVTRWPEHRRAALVGRVVQDPFRGTCPGMTVAENLRLAALRGRRHGLGRGLDRGERARYAAQLAQLGVGLERRLDADVGTLSGGQRQALTLLMAIVRRPEVLLLDEHTAALDPRAAAHVAALTERLVREQALTTLMVTHSMSQALELGDRTLMMHGGRVVDDAQGEARRRMRAQDLVDRFTALKTGEFAVDAAAGLAASPAAGPR
jgi:putative ABC transport system ATP-binding protein